MDTKINKVFRNKINGKLYEVIGIGCEPSYCFQQIDGQTAPWNHERIDVVKGALIEQEWFEEVKGYDGPRYGE